MKCKSKCKQRLFDHFKVTVLSSFTDEFTISILPLPMNLQFLYQLN